LIRIKIYWRNNFETCEEHPHRLRGTKQFVNGIAWKHMRNNINRKRGTNNFAVRNNFEA
jgi:hypothetical protein